MMRPNSVLYIVLAAAGAAGLTAVILAAESHGRRRQLKRAYLVERAR